MYTAAFSFRFSPTGLLKCWLYVFKVEIITLIHILCLIYLSFEMALMHLIKQVTINWTLMGLKKVNANWRYKIQFEGFSLVSYGGSIGQSHLEWYSYWMNSQKMYFTSANFKRFDSVLLTIGGGNIQIVFQGSNLFQVDFVILFNLLLTGIGRSFSVCWQ